MFDVLRKTGGGEDSHLKDIWSTLMQRETKDLTHSLWFLETEWMLAGVNGRKLLPYKEKNVLS